MLLQRNIRALSAAKRALVELLTKRAHLVAAQSHPVHDGDARSTLIVGLDPKTAQRLKRVTPKLDVQPNAKSVFWVPLLGHSASAQPRHELAQSHPMQPPRAASTAQVAHQRVGQSCIERRGIANRGLRTDSRPPPPSYPRKSFRGRKMHCEQGEAAAGGPTSARPQANQRNQYCIRTESGLNRGS